MVLSKSKICQNMPRSFVLFVYSWIYTFRVLVKTLTSASSLSMNLVHYRLGLCEFLLFAEFDGTKSMVKLGFGNSCLLVAALKAYAKVRSPNSRDYFSFINKLSHNKAYTRNTKSYTVRVVRFWCIQDLFEGILQKAVFNLDVKTTCVIQCQYVPFQSVRMDCFNHTKEAREIWISTIFRR